MTTTTQKPKHKIVIPDYCNSGVIFRALLALNVVFFISIMFHASSWEKGFFNFLNIAALLESSSLISIFTLCGLRRFLLRSKKINLISTWWQRAICVAIPFAVTLIIVFSFKFSEWMQFKSVSLVKTGVLALLFSVFAQYYFELRERAFSPVLVEAQVQALQARIRPHMFFNSLNAAISLIRKEPRRAETMLEDLSELFRVTMRDARTMSSLAEEIKLCGKYLSIEKVRFGDRLQVKWDVGQISEKIMRQAQVPPLILQPLLENAVHHGVEPSSKPVTIHIRIRASLNTIEVRVVNPVIVKDGQSAPAPKGNRMALRNIRERLALVYDVEAQLNHREKDGYFEVRMQFPFRKDLA